MGSAFWECEGFTSKNIEKNEKFCDTLDEKEDLLFEEELVTLLKELRNNPAQVMSQTSGGLFLDLMVMSIEIN